MGKSKDTAQQRIERSRKALAAYPKWVRKANVFHGGGVRRGK